MIIVELTALFIFPLIGYLFAFRSPMLTCYAALGLPMEVRRAANGVVAMRACGWHIIYFFVEEDGSVDCVKLQSSATGAEIYLRRGLRKQIFLTVLPAQASRHFFFLMPRKRKANLVRSANLLVQFFMGTLQMP